jgi:hypothetical protein
MNIFTFDHLLNRWPAGRDGESESAPIKRPWGMVGSRKYIHLNAFSGSAANCPSVPFWGLNELNQEPNVESSSTQGDKNGR